MTYPRAERRVLTRVQIHHDLYIHGEHNSTALTGGPMISRRSVNGEYKMLLMGRQNINDQ